MNSVNGYWKCIKIQARIINTEWDLLSTHLYIICLNVICLDYFCTPENFPSKSKIISNSFLWTVFFFFYHMFLLYNSTHWFSVMIPLLPRSLLFTIAPSVFFELSIPPVSFLVLSLSLYLNQRVRLLAFRVKVIASDIPYISALLGLVWESPSRIFSV